MAPLAGPARLSRIAAPGWRGLPAPFWVLFAGTLLNRMGSFVVPYLAIHLTTVRGFSITQAGGIAALYGLGATLAGPLGGLLADRIGRRPVMVTALFGGGLGMIALGFAADPLAIAAGAFAVALLTESYRPAMQAAVADLVPTHDRVRAFGLIYWVLNLGVAMGLFLGGWLAQWSPLLLFVGDGLTTILFGVLVLRGVPETRPPLAPAARREGIAAGVLAPLRDAPFVAFLGLSLLTSLVFMQHQTPLPLDMTAKGISRPEYGAVLALNGLLVVLLQPVLVPRLTRFARPRVLAAGALIMGAGFALGAWATTAAHFAAAVAVWTLGEILVLPLSNAVVADLAPTAARGRYQGTYGMSFALAAALAPLLGTAVLQRAGAATLWFACLGVGAVVAVGHLALAPALRRPPA